jgi:STAS domain
MAHPALAVGLPLVEQEPMLRIERIDGASGEMTVRATGRLAGPWVAELERSLSDRTSQTVVVLDLTDVSFVDREGIEFLRTLRRFHIVDLRCSAFVAEQINTDAMSGVGRTDR